jgi:AcrR family transcriptional regulator
MTPAQRKALILRAAAAECQERGYNAASVLEVAARAGVSIATLYKHFKDKHTLFSRAVEEAIKGRLPLDLKEAVGVEAHAYAGAAIFAVADVMSHPKNAWIANIMMASEISDTARIRALARREREEIETAIERIVLGWRADGLVIAGDTALATNLLLGAVERAGLLALIVFGPGAVDRRDLAVLADQAARLLLAFLKCEQRT